MSERISVDTSAVRIWLAGNLADATRICREHCFAVGLCVTVTSTEFVYTGGQESGVVIGLINYPRFPCSAEELETKALVLAETLRVGLCQWSVLIEGPKTTTWIHNRPDK